MTSSTADPDPHGRQPVLPAGAPIADARIVAILLHGRGASAEDILGLSREFRTPDVAYLAPQAAGGTWYPSSFLAPIEQNEPWLGSALALIARLLDTLQQRNIPASRVALMGFSQGACLATEFAARHPRRYASIAAFSGGLIGPPGAVRTYEGQFDGTPAFFGCSDNDPHIPLGRVHESAEVLERMGAAVEARIYPLMGHTIVPDEIEAVDALLRAT
jgi:predicted esterase